MEKALLILVGALILSVGWTIGASDSDVRASGVTIDSVNRSVVSASEDGKRVYVWDDRTRSGGKEARLRVYSYSEPDEGGVAVAYFRDIEIQAWPSSTDRVLDNLRRELEAVNKALQALEEIGDQESDAYKDLKKQAREIATKIQTHLEGKYPPEKD